MPGVFVDASQQNGATPLMLAVRNGNFDMELFLLAKKAQINETDKKDNTILHYAAEGRSVDIIKLLFERGLSINKENNEGNSPSFMRAKQVMKKQLYRNFLISKHRLQKYNKFFKTISKTIR